jgi:predicted DNA-binding WGR domain protein
MQQLEMFPEDIRIERVDHDANMYRFYRLRLMPDLFGGVSLLREWGRIGTQGRHRIDCFGVCSGSVQNDTFSRF